MEDSLQSKSNQNQYSFINSTKYC